MVLVAVVVFAGCRGGEQALPQSSSGVAARWVAVHVDGRERGVIERTHFASGARLVDEDALRGVPVATWYAVRAQAGQRSLSLLAGAYDPRDVVLFEAPDGTLGVRHGLDADAPLAVTGVTAIDIRTRAPARRAERTVEILVDGKEPIVVPERQWASLSTGPTRKMAHRRRRGLVLKDLLNRYAPGRRIASVAVGSAETVVRIEKTEIEDLYLKKSGRGFLNLKGSGGTRVKNVTRIDIKTEPRRGSAG
jgi:hypothetical protein